MVDYFPEVAIITRLKCYCATPLPWCPAELGRAIRSRIPCVPRQLTISGRISCTQWQIQGETKKEVIPRFGYGKEKWYLLRGDNHLADIDLPTDLNDQSLKAILLDGNLLRLYQTGAGRRKYMHYMQGLRGMLCDKQYINCSEISCNQLH